MDVVIDLAPSDHALDTAAAHATRNVPVATPNQRVDDLIASIRGRRFASAAVTAVCVGNRLVGVLTIERLLASQPGSLVGDVMDPDPPTVEAHQAQEEVVWEALHHNEPGLAVLDRQRNWLGLIPPHQLLAVLLKEHDEDIARLCGYLSSTASARSASEEPVLRRLWHRLRWLLVGTVGAMIAAAIVETF